MLCPFLKAVKCWEQLVPFLASTASAASCIPGPTARLLLHKSAAWEPGACRASDRLAGDFGFWQWALKDISPRNLMSEHMCPPLQEALEARSHWPTQEGLLPPDATALQPCRQHP